jgi:hypothetical protein
LLYWNIFSFYDQLEQRATTVEEAEALGKIGYSKYDEIADVHLYRRVKT